MEETDPLAEEGELQGSDTQVVKESRDSKPDFSDSEMLCRVLRVKGNQSEMGGWAKRGRQPPTYTWVPLILPGAFYFPGQ